jgi:hypothetical protein
MLTYIVGARFYPGAALAIGALREDEVVTLRAEPDNPYDRNAVAVFNAAGVKLGHVPRQEAPAVAKLLKQQLYHVATCRSRGTGALRIRYSTEAPEQTP